MKRIYAVFFLTFISLILSTSKSFCLTRNLNNDWIISSASEVKLNQSIINKLGQILDINKRLKINSVLIARNGKLVFEKYFNSYNMNKSNQLKSLGKSITSILIGIAIDNGFIKSVDAKIIDYFPEFRNLPGWDKNKEEITIRHLITMTAGFDCGDGLMTNKCINDIFFSDDMFKAYFQLNLGVKPGTVWFYNDGNVMILNRIIELASNVNIVEFQKKYLDSILGIEGNLASIEMCPRDLAKIGQLILNKGKWNNKQVVSETWLIESMGTHFIVDDNFMGKYYGFFWWQYKFNVEDQSFLTHYAYGNGGQFIFIIPEENMVVVFTGDNYNNYKSMSQPLGFLVKYILNAV